MTCTKSAVKAICELESGSRKSLWTSIVFLGEVPSTNAIQYSSKNRKYKGNERFRVSTQQHKCCRIAATLSHLSKSGSSSGTSVAQEAIKEAAFKRLCGDLCPLISHMSSVCTISNWNSKICVVCGKDSYHVYTVWNALVMMVRRELRCIWLRLWQGREMLVLLASSVTTTDILWFSSKWLSNCWNWEEKLKAILSWHQGNPLQEDQAKPWGS